MVVLEVSFGAQGWYFVHIWLVLLRDGCMEDVRPGVLQYFRFDICIFVFFGIFCLTCHVFIWEKEFDIWLFWYCFCCCMLFSKKQAVWRKEKEMKNKVMNILKYFVVSVLIFFEGLSMRKCICFGILVSYKGGLETRNILSKFWTKTFLKDFIGR